MYVLDTDVLSITNPTSGFQGAAVDHWKKWVVDNEHGLYICVVTLMEVRFGIEKCHAKGATAKAEQLRKWLAAAETVHRSRIIPVSIEIAHRAGALLYKAAAAGVMPSSEDALVAAAADVRGFTVLSRNAKHLKALTSRWLNPLEMIPPNVPWQS